MSRDTTHLTDQLSAMNAGQIRSAGAIVRRGRSSAADDLEWWSATVKVERLLRRQHLRRAAAAAASAAVRAVKRAGATAGLTVDDHDVIAVARTASEAACALVVGLGVRAETRYFLERLGPAISADPHWAWLAA